ASDQPKISRGRAYVLNYKFLNDAQVNKLRVNGFNNNGFTLYSSTLLNSTITRYEDILNDPNQRDSKSLSALRKWVTHLKASRRYFEGTSETRLGSDMITHLQSGVPFLDLMSLRTVYDSLPVFDLGHESFGIRQAFDPQEGTWTVIRADRDSMQHRPASQRGNLYFMNARNLRGTDSIAEGQVSVDANGKYSLRTITSQTGGDQYAMAVGSQTLFLLNTNSGMKPVKVDGLDITNLRSFEAYHTKERSNDSHQHAILVSITAKNGRKRTYVAYISELENGNLVARTIKEVSTSFMKAEELALRSSLKWDRNERDLILYFDGTTPVKGPAAYRKLLQHKAEDGSTVTEKYRETPYSMFMLGSERQEGGIAVYMRTASVEALVAGSESIQHRLYGSKRVNDADRRMSGLYWDPTDAVLEKDGGKRSAYPKEDEPIAIDANISGFQIKGKPIWTRGKKGSEAVLASAKPTGQGATVELNLVPYQPLGSTPDVGSFQLSLILRNVNGESPVAFQNLEIPGRFDGLVGAQIIQGKRKHDSEFHVLLLFGKSGSPQTGLYLVSGKYKKETKNQFTKYTMEMSHNGRWLDKGEVSPSDLKERIRPDVQGRLYWFDNPDEEVDSLRFRVRELSSPENLRYPNKAGADSSIALRFDEGEEENDGKTTMAGDWGINSAHTLKNIFPAFKEYTDMAEKRAKKDKKKESANPYAMDTFTSSETVDAWKKKHRPASPQFVEFLDSLAGPLTDRAEGEPKRRIILVEDDMRDQFITDFAAHAAHFGSENGFDISWGGRNKFGLYPFDMKSTVEESVEEYAHMRGAAQRKPIVMATTLRILNKGGEFVNEAKEGEAASTAIPSRWLMMATDGKRFDIRKQRTKLKPQGVEVPTIIIGTPSELEYAKANAKVENDLGVFDEFEIDNRFLTSSWMHWSPGSKKARPSMKEHTKAVVSEEEYKVFPDLEALFTKAAKGQMKGEQIALVVPKELKPLIHKLVMSRWATKDRQLAGPWHYSNRELVFYQLSGRKEDNPQSKVFENFQAMRGAADFRNVVNYSDLERIINIGRPVNNQGRQFRLTDPALKNAAEAVLSLDATSEEAAQQEGEESSNGGFSANEIDDMNDELAREHSRREEAIGQIRDLKERYPREYQEHDEYEDLVSTKAEAEEE
ncbi:MAG: hypothetical protein AAF202_02080, partial [Pseudomonadota bacterium]